MPLEELAGRAGRAGGGAPTAVEPSGTVRQAAVKRHRHPTAHRGSAGAADGPLPFTGLALLTLVLAGAALVSVGGPLRRATRARKRAGAAPPPPAPIVARPLPAVGGPAAPGRAQQGGHAPVRVAGLAVLGLVGLAVLASHRRA